MRSSLAARLLLTLGLVCGLTLGIYATNSYAGDLFDVLKRMSDADQKKNYQGTFILRKSDNLSTLRVTHGVDDEGVWESLEALNGEPRKILRHNNRVISIYPGRELVTIRHTSKNQSLHQQLPDNLDQLETYYSISRLNDDRVADQQTLVIELKPKDTYRYGYRYWIDENSGMLLRCDLVTEDNRIVEQMMFTSVNYLSQAPVQAFDLERYQGYRQQVMDEQVLPVPQDEAQRWKVNNLPAGFMLNHSAMRYSQLAAIHKNNSSPEAHPDLLHLAYSDGLASVSIFIELNLNEADHMKGASSMGAVNAFGQPVDGYFVTVVGEVPLKTVQSMAQSIVLLP
ncbi:MAG: MucB/RseB C-terminal domain-containing protein [Proteobacteria bacterium]|nr:MucB/RseB C-terminal domain-containing protein [Pseudomonadota bacterium]